jgi:stage II sporulation protein D
LDVVTVVPLEPYVERAVAGEIYASWPMEALKAQAVAARTYALHSCEQSTEAPFDVESSVLSQRYETGPVPGRVRDAVRATRGEFLAYDGEPILAAFHTTAGGETAASEEVWGESRPYLKRVESPDEESPEYFWSYEIEMAELRRALAEAGIPTESDNGVRVLERTPSGRVARLEIAGAQLSGRELRRVLGRGAFRSTLFEVRVHGDQVRFLGSGAGHGVGLSQWGARKMARQGKTYREILVHYFPGTRVRSLEDVAAGPPGEEGRR